MTRDERRWRAQQAKARARRRLARWRLGLEDDPAAVGIYARTRQRRSMPPAGYHRSFDGPTRQERLAEWELRIWERGEFDERD